MILIEKIRGVMAILWPNFWPGIISAFLDPRNEIGVYALICVPAFLILAVMLGRAFDFSGVMDERRRHDKGLAGLLRWVFPRRLLRSKSVLQDLNIFFFNTVLLVPLILLAMPSIAPLDGESRAVHALFGLLHLEPGAPESIGTNLGLDLMYACLLLFVANFVNWVIHWSMHKVSFLWEIHKIHHTAEYLTGLTNSRAHFLELIIFRPAGVIGTVGTAVLFNRLFGITPRGSANITVVAAIYLVTAPVNFLFHSPYWISFGRLENVFISPAMHQIHHSADPKHYNRNFGSTFSVYDWMFGTLLKTEKTPPADLKLGIVEAVDWNRATYWQTVYLPIKASLSHLRFWKAP